MLIILSERRRSPADSRWSAGEFRARSLDSEFSEARMIERNEMASMRELWIAIRVGAVLHLMSGNGVRLKPGFYGATIELSAPGCDRRIDRVAMI